MEKDFCLVIRLSVVVCQDIERGNRFAVSCLNELEINDLAFNQILEIFLNSLRMLTETEICNQINLLKVEVSLKVMSNIYKTDEYKNDKLFSSLIVTVLKSDLDDEKRLISYVEDWIKLKINEIDFCPNFFNLVSNAKTLKHVDVLSEFLFDKVRFFFF